MDKKYSLEQTISSLLENKRYSSVKDILVTLNAVDIAAIFGELSEDALPLLFRLLPKELAADAFVEMDADRQESLITRFSDTELKAVIDELYIDDAVDLVEEMPANVVKRILKQADPDTRKLINELLKYPDDCAGSIMNTEFVELRTRQTIADAIRVIRREGLEKETINDCFVTNADRTLAGIISLRTLILSKDEDLVGDRMDTNVISVTTMEDQESVAEKFKKYDLTAMPVVDGENRLVGIVTVDDAIDVMEEEATEDIEKMAAMTPSDKPYLKTSVWDIYKHRIPWLMLLMVSATFTGLIITKFEHALAAQVVLTAYIPMLMDTGGNSGSQSSVTIIRGLSLSEIHFKDIFAVLWKEIRVAVLCGLSLAVVNFAKLLLLDRVGAQVALVVSLTLVVTVAAAKFIGCTLPLLAKKIGFDPAVMASPLITTIVDALALLTYFGIASSLLHI
ncbi:MAG: magnesium transporter [Eubacteriales bacterium]|nr:magnesium transporter [Clostridiales bacterium]MDD7396105.1 magnesium transporter [Eubacteriales bacterium]MDY2983458.1 magnesium transporter [Eubacteriales bacterium]